MDELTFMPNKSFKAIAPVFVLLIFYCRRLEVKDSLRFCEQIADANTKHQTDLREAVSFFKRKIYVLRLRKYHKLIPHTLG